MIDVTMPQLGESVTEGTVGRWLKQVGEPVSEFEPLLEVTTDKVDTEITATATGTVLEILVGEGETVRVGTVIARLSVASDVPMNGAASTVPVKVVAESAAPALPSAAMSLAYISPVVARLAAEQQVNLAEVRGTGSGGRVTKRDLEQFIQARTNAPAPAIVPSAPAPSFTVLAPSAADADAPITMVDREEVLNPRRMVDPDPAPHPVPPPPSPPIQRADVGTEAAPLTPSAPSIGPDDELVPLSSMRRAIAQHMVHSKRTAPHVTTVIEVDMSRVALHRARSKADYARQGVNLTYTAYFVRAAVAALRDVPLVNSTFTDAGILQHQRIHIGLAVAIPDGLIVPVIKDADDKSLLGLARSVNDLAERARTRRLKPDDTQGGTFTITNHGVSGSLWAMPIINQPQSAILGVGALQKRVVVVTEHGLDAIAIRPMAYFGLTFDHRVIDGATGDAFLGVIKRVLEQWTE